MALTRVTLQIYSHHQCLMIQSLMKRWNMVIVVVAVVVVEAVAVAIVVKITTIR